jgi:ubiquinone/menaquinone biosynthesis C-methylase UbiE
MLGRMVQAVDERVQRYILDGTDEDLRRLVGIAHGAADMARTALRKVGVQEGWRAIDCGCGPLGGMAVMSEMVGPSGRVVGLDFNPSTVEKARTVAASLGLGNVEVVVGDVHDIDPAQLGGPFDVAYTRLFLMHQVDAVATLRKIGGLLRPGGWLVSHEAMRTPPPRSHPNLDALGAYWDLLYRLLDRAGVPFGAVEDLPGSAREAGFEVCGLGGSAYVMDPAMGFELHAATLAAIRERALQAGVATPEQIDNLLRGLRVARDSDYEWVFSPFLLDLALRKPETPQL